jgi:hypothetical protein
MEPVVDMFASMAESLYEHAGLVQDGNGPVDSREETIDVGTVTSGAEGSRSR